MRRRRLAATLLTSGMMLLSLVATAPAASAQVADGPTGVTSTTPTEPSTQVIAKWRNWCYTYEAGWAQCPATTFTWTIWP